jgi:hypothetical protein
LPWPWRVRKDPDLVQAAARSDGVEVQDPGMLEEPLTICCVDLFWKEAIWVLQLVNTVENCCIRYISTTAFPILKRRVL